MKTLARFIAIGLLGAVAAPAAAQAQAPGEVSVTGSGTAGSYTFVLDAHSGPSGENPTGTASISFNPSVFTRGPVTCLAVVGNRAVIGIENGPGSLTAGEGTLIEVSDDPDALFFRLYFEPPSTCPTDPSGYTPIPVTDGNITISKAPPLPTSKDQCKNGGWRNYGTTFQNQGDCVSSVNHQARQQCAFIRAAHGRPAFRAWYGASVTKRYAMRRCVQQRSEN